MTQASASDTIPVRLTEREEGRTVDEARHHRSFSEPLSSGSARQTLTARETEVLQLVLARYRNAEIADALVVSVRTVESHIAALFRKFGVTDRSALIQVVYADERDRVADERDRVADERDRVADERDRVADERDRVADERDRVADERDSHANERERVSDGRGGVGDEGDGSLDERLRRTAEHAAARSRRADQAAQRSDERRFRSKAALARAADRDLRARTEDERLAALGTRDSADRHDHTYQVMRDGHIIAEATTIEETVQQLQDRDDLGQRDY